MQLDGAIQWLVSAEGEVMPAAVGESRWRKRALNWASRERFPSASTVGPDLGERRLAQQFPRLLTRKCSPGHLDVRLAACPARSTNQPQYPAWSLGCLISLPTCIPSGRHNTPLGLL